MSFSRHAEQFESNTHYSDLMCLRETGQAPKYDESLARYTDQFGLGNMRDNLKHRCVLPEGHEGKCTHKYDFLLKDKKEPTSEKLLGSIDLAIYSTPGNDDFVCKNRASRLYKVALTNEQEKEIRDKNEKKKCAIPLKDASTPILLAQSYLDWWTFIIHTEGIEGLLADTPLAKSVMDMLKMNKQYLQNVVFHNRQIFDNEGYSICVIRRNRLKITDFADPTRNNRTEILDTDIQLGHCVPRSDNYPTIRGGNLIPMSRRGNLIIGEHLFTEDKWIEELQNIVKFY